MNRHTAESSSAHRGTFCPFQHSKGNLDLLTCIGTYLGLFDTYRGTSGVLSIYRGISKVLNKRNLGVCLVSMGTCLDLMDTHRGTSAFTWCPQEHAWVCPMLTWAHGVYLMPTGGISGSGRHSHEHMWVCLVPSEHI